MEKNPDFSQALKMTPKVEVKTAVLTVSLSDVAGAIVYHAALLWHLLFTSNNVDLFVYYHFSV